MTINWKTGLTRAWIVVACLWVLSAGAFLSLAAFRFDAGAVALLVLPPALLYAAGVVAAWMLKGFRAPLSTPSPTDTTPRNPNHSETEKEPIPGSIAAVTSPEEIPWSQNPGCNERHLHQRHASPLFPDARRHVTVADVARAQALDAAEAEELLRRTLALVGEIDSMPEEVPLSRMLELRRTFDQLLEDTASVGGPADSTETRLLQLHATWLESVEGALAEEPEALQQLRCVG